MTDEEAGELAGVLTVGDGLLTRDNRVHVAARALHEAAAAGWEVGNDVRREHTERVTVDHVDIGLVSGREHAAVEEADRLGSRAAMLLHEPRHIERRAS